MNYIIQCACISHVGNCRDMNQDNFLFCGQYMTEPRSELFPPIIGSLSSKKSVIVGVFDGLGGEKCGETAARIAANTAAELVIGRKPKAALSAFCAAANNSICKYMEEHNVDSMGTTAAMLLFSPREITLCNIGDSKIFRYSNGILSQISVDHVTAAVYGKKPPLTQYLGIPPDTRRIEPYIAGEHYQEGDLYLICSDGLADMVSEDEIAQTLAETRFDELPERLLCTALDHGGRDNITIILCKIRCQNNSVFKALFRYRKKEM